MNAKRWFGWAVVACAACCALPFLFVAAVGVGGVAAIGMDTWLCAALMLLAALGWYRVRRKRLATGSCATTGKSHCASNCGCK